MALQHHTLPVRRDAFAKGRGGAAFFIGNGVPKELAYRPYHDSNPTTTNELVRQLFYSRYSLWQTSDTVRSLFYYDVRMKKHVRLHVPYYTAILTHREFPIPVPSMRPPLGPGQNRYAQKNKNDVGTCTGSTTVKYSFNKTSYSVLHSRVLSFH